MVAAGNPSARAGSSAVLDACVLFPAALRDTLLRAADAGLYRPQWSHAILEEVRRNLIAAGRLDATRAQRLLAAMRREFPEAEVRGYEALVPAMTNDPKDRHVLAAAVSAGGEHHCHAQPRGLSGRRAGAVWGGRAIAGRLPFGSARCDPRRARSDRRGAGGRPAHPAADGRAGGGRRRETRAGVRGSRRGRTGPNFCPRPDGALRPDRSSPERPIVAAPHQATPLLSPPNRNPSPSCRAPQRCP